MSSNQFLRIFYFYLQVKVRQINKQYSEIGSTEGKNLKKNFRFFARTAGKVALITFLLYQTFFYLNMGRFLLPKEYFNAWLLQLETVLGFLYILSIFLIFPLISRFVNTRLNHLPPLLKIPVELLMVFITNSILLSLIHFAPLLLFFPEVEPSPDRIRTSYLVTGIFSLFFYFFVERERSKKHLQKEMLRSARLQKENFEAELQNLKNQVSPHFLFNSLNVLASLIPLDQNKAVEFTSRLSDLYRLLLENSVLQLIPLRKELQVAEAYIYLLETRFGEAVKFNLEVPSEKLNHLLPPGALQLLLENAIKHNGSTRKKPLHIKVFSEADKLVVTNNLQPRKEKIISTKKGLENIKSRYRYFTDEPVEITSNASEFIVRIPLLKESANEDLNN